MFLSTREGILLEPCACKEELGVDEFSKEELGADEDGEEKLGEDEEVPTSSWPV